MADRAKLRSAVSGQFGLLLLCQSPHIAKSMLRAALRRARPASSVTTRRGIASGLNLLELPTSDLQLARTWDAAEADGVNAASGGAPSPPSRLFSVE